MINLLVVGCVLLKTTLMILDQVEHSLQFNFCMSVQRITFELSYFDLDI